MRRGGERPAVSLGCRRCCRHAEVTCAPNEFTSLCGKSRLPAPLPAPLPPESVLPPWALVCVIAVGCALIPRLHVVVNSRTITARRLHRVSEQMELGCLEPGPNDRSVPFCNRLDLTFHPLLLHTLFLFCLHYLPTKGNQQPLVFGLAETNALCAQLVGAENV